MPIKKLKKPKKVNMEAQVAVHCGKCKTPYHRHRKEVGKEEVCGVCLNKGVLVEGHLAKKKKTKSG